MKLSKEKSEALKQNLPPDAVSKIYRKLNKKITERMIRKILAGDNEDYYSVISIASNMALAFKKEKKVTEEKLKKILS